MLKLLINLILFTIILFTLRFIIKSNSTKFKKIIKIISFLIIIWIICFSSDYILAKNQKLPLFCSKLFGIFSYQDGGTVEYIGLGYKVIDFHVLLTDPYLPGEKLEKKYLCSWNTTYREAKYIIQKIYTPRVLDYIKH